MKNSQNSNDVVLINTMHGKLPGYQLENSPAIAALHPLKMNRNHIDM